MKHILGALVALCLLSSSAFAACTVNIGAAVLPSNAASLATQPSDQVVIKGGCIDTTPIGQNTTAAGSFTSLSSSGTLTASGTGAGTLAGAYTFTNPLITFGNSGGAPTHIATAQTTAPALTSCGGGSPAITGTDEAGIVTMGTTATGCVITFNVAYTGTPFCVVSWIATPLASQSYVTSNTAITTTQTSTSSNKLQYICRAPSGG